MADPIFSEPRLAGIYDALDPDRRDLDAYDAIVDEFAARTVLDIGCGTGSLACRLAARGINAIGLDPAAASLEVAQNKPFADRVRWLHGDATELPPLQVDLATMTGNVAQVFLTDADWVETLAGILAALRRNGRLVFEVRVPARRAWLEWTREQSYRRTDIPGVGLVQSWVQGTEVSGELVSFRWTYVFEADGAVLTSDSTLRFRERDAIEQALEATGFVVEEVRDAPDRPGLEWVFIARRTA